jgi:hypothetical protein
MGARDRVTLAGLLICLCAPAGAGAAQSAELHVGLSPQQLGASTTISFGFTIAAPGGELPPALTLLDVRLAPGMRIDTTGLATCTQKLLARGPKGCSTNARVGGGSVDVKVPLGNQIRPELATLSVFNGPRIAGHTTLLFYAAGRLPIATQLVFTGVILPSPRGERIEAKIPLIPTLPETPDAAIVAMSSTLGTRGQTYFRTSAAKRVRFTPKGATMPTRCPAGGLPFTAEFHFNDDSAAQATSTVRCPG